MAPTFNEGTATLNGEAFNSGQTIASDGDYTLTVVDGSNNSTTVTFKIEKIASNISNLTYKTKKATNSMGITFYRLNLPGKLRAKGFLVKLNGRRVNIINVRNTAEGLVVNVKLKYAKWPRGRYNLVMNYGYKNRKTWIRGSASKNNLFSIE